MIELTQAEVRRQFVYNADTGQLVRKSTGNAMTTASHNGHGNAYYRTGVNGKSYYVHRLIWLYVHGVWPDVIDHKDRDSLNNRLANLRGVTTAVNRKNNGTQVRNKSGVSGVHKSCGTRWFATICIDYTQINLGSFGDWFEAVCARKSAENLYYGEHNVNV